MTPTERQEAFIFLLLTFSLFAMMLVRRRIGIRVLSPERIAHMFLIGQAYVFFGVALLGGSRGDMVSVEALVSLATVCAALRHISAVKDASRGIRTHSWSTGASTLLRWRLIGENAFLLRYRRTYRFLDPLWIGYIAAWFSILSRPIAVWIGWSALCLMLLEHHRWRFAVERDRDIADGLCEGEAQQAIVQHYKTGVRPSVDASTDGSIPTGLAPDIDQHLAKRKGGRT